MKPPARQCPRPLRLLLACTVFVLLSLPPPAAAQEIRYIYDELNRLIGVIDPQGNAAQYVYDAVGNILQIKRFNLDPSATVAIGLVTPNRGKAGTEVTIYGKGFSATPAENQVTFNGTPAAVTAATTTSLVTSVPSGATSGSIRVSAPLGTALSPEPFSVPFNLEVIPPDLDLAAGSSFDFRAELDGSPASVTWRVNGVEGGSAAMGWVTPEGLYTAPRTLPPVQPVTLEAVLVTDPAQVAQSEVRVTAQAAGLVSAAPVIVGLAAVGAGLATAAPVVVAAPAAASGQTAAAPVVVAMPGAASGQTTAAVVTAAVATSPTGQTAGGVLTVTAGPTLAGVAPSGAARGATAALSLTGANLQGATAVVVLRDGVVDATVTTAGVNAAPDGTTVTCTLTIGGTAPTGPRVLQVVTPAARTTPLDIATNRFTVTP